MKFIGYSPTDFKNQNKPVILTEFQLNDSLQRILELERKGEKVKGWDDTKKLINIFGIASAMAYLHSYNIIHRDLQPCNIYLDDYLFPKIGDFGLSKRIHNVDTLTYQTTSGLKGSPTYSSPEILKFNDYSKSGDVYAFAFVVFEIVSNDLPFKDLYNKNQIYNEVVLNENRPEIPSFVPDCYRNLIEKCWSQDPKERPSFDAIVDHLKNNINFITRNIRKEDYTNYIEFIGKSQLSFDFKHQILNLDDFIKSKSKTDENEQKVKEDDSSNNNDEKSNDQENDDKNELNKSEGNYYINDQDNDLSDNNKLNRAEMNDCVSDGKDQDNDLSDKNKLNKAEGDDDACIDDKDSLQKEIEKESQIINKCITFNDARTLMEYLHNECENDKISSIFDRCFFKHPKFYLELCKEGLKLDNAVAHHKHAVSLIFSNRSPEELNSNFYEARSHLEESIRRGYKESHFLLARVLHEFFHDDKRAFEIASEGCKMGDKYSTCLLGFYVARGIGTVKNRQKGVSLMLESGASDLYEEFSTDIGIYYIKLAESHAHDDDTALLYKQKAFEFFQKAFIRNKTRATISNYGLCYLLGMGVSKNLIKAKEIFQLGDANCRHHLHFIHEELFK